MSLEFDALRRFLESQMRMSHIYQPLMLRTILQGGGTATTRQIAAAFLAEDESQLEYYEAITNRMPGKVLRRHGVVERNGDRYSLAPNVVGLSPSETDALIALCDAAITKFKAARGAAIWEHRAVGLGQIPGKLRYETLKRAGFRCELCGVPADERALDVDHIIPRKATISGRCPRDPLWMEAIFSERDARCSCHPRPALGDCAERGYSVRWRYVQGYRRPTQGRRDRRCLRTSRESPS